VIVPGKGPTTAMKRSFPVVGRTRWDLLALICYPVFGLCLLPFLWRDRPLRFGGPSSNCGIWRNDAFNATASAASPLTKSSQRSSCPLRLPFSVTTTPSGESVITKGRPFINISRLRGFVRGVVMYHLFDFSRQLLARHGHQNRNDIIRNVCRHTTRVTGSIPVPLAKTE
jgi:hypothetical protein